MVVLVENIERNVLGSSRVNGLGGRELCINAVAGMQRIGGAGRSSVHAHQAGGEGFLPSGAAECGPLFGEPAVEARGSGFGDALLRILHAICATVCVSARSRKVCRAGRRSLGLR